MHLMYSEAVKELFIKPNDTDSFTAMVIKQDKPFPFTASLSAFGIETFDAWSLRGKLFLISFSSQDVMT